MSNRERFVAEVMNLADKFGIKCELKILSVADPEVPTFERLFSVIENSLNDVSLLHGHQMRYNLNDDKEEAILLYMVVRDSVEVDRTMRVFEFYEMNKLERPNFPIYPKFHGSIEFVTMTRPTIGTVIATNTAFVLNEKYNVATFDIRDDFTSDKVLNHVDSKFKAALFLVQKFIDR